MGAKANPAASSSDDRLLSAKVSRPPSRKSSPEKVLAPAFGIMLVRTPLWGNSAESAPVSNTISAIDASSVTSPMPPTDWLRPPSCVPVSTPSIWPWLSAPVEPCTVGPRSALEPAVARKLFRASTPGAYCIPEMMLCAAGSALTSSVTSTICSRVLTTSTSGASPLTVTDSAIWPTASSASTFAVKEPSSTMPSRTTVRNPCRLKVTE